MELAYSMRIRGEWAKSKQYLSSIYSKKSAPDAEYIESKLALARVLNDEAMFGGHDNFAEQDILFEEIHGLLKSFPNNAHLAEFYDIKGFSTHIAYLFSDRSKVPVKALELFQKAYDMARDLHLSHVEAEAKFHIGLFYDVVKQDYDKAQVHHKIAYDLANSIGDKVIASYAIRHLGFSKFGLGDRRGARLALEASLHLRQESGFLPGAAFALASIASLDIEDGKQNKARERLIEARSILSKLDAAPRLSWIESELENLAEPEH